MNVHHPMSAFTVFLLAVMSADSRHETSTEG
jgi:hypothetical protein